MEGYILNIDGTSNNKDTIIGIVLMTSERSTIEQSYILGFPATNNEAKYEPLIAGLRMTMTLVVTRLEVHCDSLLVVS